MKIAILTQPLGKNYGGIIQNYAMQKILLDHGYEPTTLNRQHQKPSYIKLFLRYGNRIAKKILGSRKAPILIEDHYERIFENTHKFIDNRIKLSKPLFSTSELSSYVNDVVFEAIIVGSDQTWRPMYSPSINNYYLDFSKNPQIKKIAYASSFGVDHWEYNELETSQCRSLAKKFDAISVREESGLTLCKDKLEVKSEVVLDPTLLLNSDDYKTLIEHIDPSERKGKIFTYWLDYNREKHVLEKMVSEELGKDYFSSYSKKSISDLSSSDVDDYKLPPIESWLASFRDSDFILTDSFHGMVFSIIFKKQFLIVTNKSRGATRFESLLGKLMLKHRIIRDKSELIEKLKYKIDHNEVTPILENLKSQSLNFLLKSLK